jgi:hypothetical protein
LSAEPKFSEMALDWSGETLLAAALSCESVNGAWQPPQRGRDAGAHIFPQVGLPPALIAAKSNSPWVRKLVLLKLEPLSFPFIS